MLYYLSVIFHTKKNSNMTSNELPIVMGNVYFIQYKVLKINDKILIFQFTDFRGFN